MVAKLVLMAVKCNFSAEKNLTDSQNNTLTLSDIKITNLTDLHHTDIQRVTKLSFYIIVYQ